MNKKYVLLSIGLSILIVAATLSTAFGLGFIAGIATEWDKAYQTGYMKGIQDLANHLQVDVSVTNLGNGSFQILTFTNGTLTWRGIGTLDCEVQQFRNGIPIDYSRNTGNLTKNGALWLQQQISGVSNVSQGKYISVSNSNDSYADTWTAIPSEFTTGGWARATGTFGGGTPSAGSLAWTVTYTFTSLTGAHYGVRRYGLNCLDSTHVNYGLICTDISTARNVMTTDSLAVTWTCTVTYQQT